MDWVAAKKIPGLVPNTNQSTEALVPAHQDGLDYEILGSDLQYVRVDLKPNQQVVAQAGAMMYCSGDVAMDTILGSPGKSQSFFRKIFTAGKRVVGGESLFLASFKAPADKGAQVAFAAPSTGKILPVHLAELGGELLCQRDAFLAAGMGVELDIVFQRRMATGFVGGEGFILQRLHGNNIAFLHAGGMVEERELAPGETLRLDTGCLVAFQPSVDYNVQFTGNLKTGLFGGEGLFLATLTGPGKVWLQSLPFKRLAGAYYRKRQTFPLGLGSHSWRG